MKKIIIPFCIFFVILLSYTSYASNYTFTANANKTTVNPGDEVTISLKVSDIEAGKNGINVVETTLEYDTSLFENFEIIDKNDWKSTYNSNQGNRYGKLLYTKMVTGVTEDQEIGILKFKLKDNLDEQETQIKLFQVTSNDGYELMNDGDKIITLKIVKPSIPVQPEPDTEPDAEPEKPSNIEDEDNGTVMGVQTGDLLIIVIIILLLVIIINLIIFFYYKLKKSK